MKTLPFRSLLRGPVFSVILLTGVALSGASPHLWADDANLIKNGSFEDGDGFVGWMVFCLEPSDNEWLKVVDGPESGERAVEMISGPPDRYISQDVEVEGGADYVLRWKVKGAGRGSVGVVPRTSDGTLLKDSSALFDTGSDFQGDEMEIPLPPEAVTVRVTLAALPPEGTIAFDQVELVRK